jgi:hypothetical protein
LINLEPNAVRDKGDYPHHRERFPSNAH